MRLKEVIGSPALPLPKIKPGITRAITGDNYSKAPVIANAVPTVIHTYFSGYSPFSVPEHQIDTMDQLMKLPALPGCNLTEEQGWYLILAYYNTI